MSHLFIENTRIIDPESSYDAIGNILIEDGLITNFGEAVKAPKGTQILDGSALICAPGLIDMRVTTGEPGRENRETLETAAQAAIAGGVTSMVIMPETNPVIDNLSLVDFLQRRSEALPVNIHIGAALTKDLDGGSMTEIGLLREAGAVLFSNGPDPITDAQIMRRMLSYSISFDALIANRAVTPALSNATVAHESDFASRLGLTSAPAASERIMAERDIALAELTGGRLLIDLISSAQTLEPIRRAKARYMKKPHIRETCPAITRGT